MHPPRVDLIHQKTSRLDEEGSIINPYYFQGYNRRKGDMQVVRLKLVDEAGSLIRRSVIRLPKLSVRDYQPPTRTVRGWLKGKIEYIIPRR